MSIEKQLIARIDALESNQRNKTDLSKRASEKIKSELAELDAFVVALDLNPQQAEKLRESFEKDLQKILNDTRNHYVNLEYVIEQDIGNKSTPEEVKAILDIPGASLSGVLDLLNTHYDVNLSLMLRIHGDNPDLDFRDIKELVFSYIEPTQQVESKFPNILRDDIISLFYNGIVPSDSKTIAVLLSTAWDFNGFIAHIDSLGSPRKINQYVERFLFFAERLPRADSRTIRYIVEKYPGDVDEYMNRFQFLQDLFPDADSHEIYTIIKAYDVVET